MYYGAIAITIGANVLYHIMQKLTPPSVNPMLTLIVTYMLAAAVCVALLPAFPLTSPLGTSLRQLNFASLGLAVAVVGLETGFLLAYRAGGSISTAALVSSTAVGVLLIPVGVGFFRERPTPIHALGLLVCLAGLVLVNWKR